MTKHATVVIGNMVIPLIGVPAAATEEVCGACGRKGLHISQVAWTNAGIVCHECLPLVDKEVKDLTDADKVEICRRAGIRLTYTDGAMTTPPVAIVKMGRGFQVFTRS